VSVIEGGTEAVQGREDGVEIVEEGRALQLDLGNLATRVYADSRAPEKAGGEGGHQ